MTEIALVTELEWEILSTDPVIRRFGCLELISYDEWTEWLDVFSLDLRNRPRRPGRRAPSLVKISEYWDLGSTAICVRCRADTGIPWREASGYVQRAHIIDRVFDGLDVVWNILPLCGRCHGGQPSFKSGEEAAALAWFGVPFHVTPLP